MKSKPRTIFVGLDLYYSQDFVDDRYKEIERLNNIINIANKKLKNISKSSSVYNYQCKIEEVINILQELKGSDKE